MPKKAFILFASANGAWKLATPDGTRAPLLDVELPPEATPEPMAQALAKTLAEHGYRGEGIVLAIPSTWCLAAAVRTEKLPRKQRRAAMIYRFEELLPLPAEQLVCDFVESATSALGVAARVDQLDPLIRSLEQRGVAVQHICPVVLLALQHIDPLASPVSREIVLLGCDEQTEVVLMEDGRPGHWYTLPSEGTAGPLLHVDRLCVTGSQPLSVRAYRVSDELAAVLSDRSDVSLVTDDRSLQELAASAAARLLRGEIAPLIDLRRDALAVEHPLRQARRPLLAAAASIVLALITLTAVLGWRGRNYARLASDLRAEQGAMFQKVLPSRPVPEAPVMHLASEERKLRGVSGAANLPQSPSALRLLHETLRTLPPGMRVRLLDARLEDGTVSLEGQARSHAEADAVATALRRSPLLAVDPPRTEQLRTGGVSFVIHATSKGQERGQ